jgi:hypothetical protein
MLQPHAELTSAQGSSAKMLLPWHVVCMGKGMDNESTEFWLVWLACVLAAADLIIYIVQGA